MRAHRLGYIDSVRGLILVLMALDHASVFWNRGRVASEGLPVYERGTLAFVAERTDSLAQRATRFVTHVCAPGFIFLAGMMVAFSSARGDRDERSRRSLSAHLWARGAVFVVLEITFIRLIWGYNQLLWPAVGNGSGAPLGFGIISLFGLLFMAMALGRRAPMWPVLGCCVAIPAAYWAILPSLAIWTYEAPTRLLLDVAPALYLPVGAGTHGISTGLYPLVPWIPVMGAGLVYGRWLAGRHERGQAADAKKLLLVVGGCLVALFLLLHDGLGERFSKYPPSPGFLAVTVGALCLVLGLAQFLEEKGISLGLLQTYGKAPFFFYVAHLLLYSLVPSLSGKCGHFSLPTTYAAWLAGLAILYFPCRWYYDVRQSHKESLLKYL